MRTGIGDLDLDFFVVELALAQALAEGLARAVAFLRCVGRGAVARLEAEVARLRQQDVEHAVFRCVFGACAHLGHFGQAGLLDADVDQVADDGVHVAAHVTDFGELGRFDLDERRIGQLGQATGDLGFTDAGRADHEDVLGRDFVAQRFFDLLAAPAVAQGDCHCLLGLALADHVFVEFADDFLGSHVHAGSSVSMMWFKLV